MGLCFEVGTGENFRMYREDVRGVKKALEGRLGLPILPVNL